MTEAWATFGNFLGSLSWGTVGDWFSGVLTSVGVIIALVQVRDVRKSEQRRADQVQRANAIAVTATGFWHGGRDAIPMVAIEVINGGSLPIFETQLLVEKPFGASLTHRFGTIPAGATVRAELTKSVGSVPANLVSQAAQCEVRFRDAEGSIWASVGGRMVSKQEK